MRSLRRFSRILPNIEFSAMGLNWPGCGLACSNSFLGIRIIFESFHCVGKCPSLSAALKMFAKNFLCCLYSAWMIGVVRLSGPGAICVLSDCTAMSISSSVKGVSSTVFSGTTLRFSSIAVVVFVGVGPKSALRINSIDSSRDDVNVPSDFSRDGIVIDFFYFVGRDLVREGEGVF